MKRFSLLLLCVFVAFNLVGCLNDPPQNGGKSGIEVMGSSESVLQSASPENGADKLSLNEEAIMELLRCELFGNNTGWADAKPSGIDLYYKNQPNGIDKVVKAPIKDADINRSAFYVTEAITAITFGGLDADKTITVRISKDMGSTWEDSIIDISDKHSDFILKYIGFTSDTHGYLVLMTKKENDEFYIFLTSDCGKTWNETGYYSYEKDRVLEACFSTQKIGFLAGGQNSKPLLLQTIDGGKGWDAVDIMLPEDIEYDKEAFAHAPVFNGPDGILSIALLYNKGNAKNVYFATSDYGNTWTYWGKGEDISKVLESTISS